MGSRANPVFSANLIVLEIIPQSVKPVLSRQMLLILHLLSSPMPSFLAISCPHQTFGPSHKFSKTLQQAVLSLAALLHPFFPLGPLPSSWLGLCACVRLGVYACLRICKGGHRGTASFLPLPWLSFLALKLWEGSRGQIEN